MEEQNSESILKKINELKEGSIIEGYWPEPLEVKKIEKRGKYLYIIGTTIFSNKTFEQYLSFDQLEKIQIRPPSLEFSASGEEVFLALEATRYQLASLFDPLLAMNISKIDPLPFQIEAVYGYILRLPKIRFLIADDPGAGKTIMAGLVIKELKLRKIAKRILLVVPGHLKDQWKREMWEKFQENFFEVNRNTFNALFGENPWKRENQIITSIDFAKREDILPSLTSVNWDLVVVDEAHKMAAYRYNNQLKKTERYRLGEILSRTTDHLLFLTATPHKGDPENFRLFLDLLSPGFFATKQLIEESLQNRDNPLFIRRMKEDMKDFEGKPIFTRRFAKTIKFRLSEKEAILYNKLSEYVVSQYNLALQATEKRNIAFALLILQRRMASSVYALLKSLQRRRKRLEELLKEPEVSFKPLPLIRWREIEDYSEKERWEEERKWETLSIAENKEELQKEISTLQDLEEMCNTILQEESEIKLSKLKEVVQGLKNEKILIFTESKDTLDYLVQKIREWGYSVNYIHGGMNLEERIEAEKIFKHQTQIMVATEAAGEGINLQFCHLMINYDIPWNPNRLEQRMGRIHRYGQQKDVYIFNLVAENTREGKVLARMFDKLEEIRNALGSDKVFDVIGEIFFEKDLYRLIVEAVSRAKTMEEILAELDEIEVDEEYIQKIKETLIGESLATRQIDYTRIKELAQKAKEYRLIPEYIEEFFKKALQKAGGDVSLREDGFLRVKVPYEIKSITNQPDFKRTYGTCLKEYPKITFDKETAFMHPEAEFVSFGHPLFEALLEWVKKKYFAQLQKGAVFEDPSGRLNGTLWFFEVEIKDGGGKTADKRLVAILDSDEGLNEINPAILWDLVPKKKHSKPSIALNKERVQGYAVELGEKYKKKILEERKRQANIKEKYGIRSLEYLIEELDIELTQLYERQAKGEKIDVVIHNKEKRKKEYQSALEELKRELQQETNLIFSAPKFLGAILIVPPSSKEMVSDEEVEKKGMEIAMEYERQQGRVPEDVSKENLGFDIRSREGEKMRYIEVKARKDEGFVALTPNEWFKAKRFKEQYWLYIVTNVFTNPTLYLIQDPANTLKVKPKIESVRFLISSTEWKTKGKKQFKPLSL